MDVASYKGQLNGTDWKKILIGFGLAAAGAVLSMATDLIPGLNIPPQYKVALAAVISTLLNLVRKTVQGIPDPRRP